MHACFLRKTTAISAGTSVFNIAVCICSLWSVVFAQNILFDSFGLPVKTPTCGCLCAQKPSQSRGKNSQTYCLKSGRPHLIQLCGSQMRSCQLI